MSIAIILVVSGIGYFFIDAIGYRSIALILLFTVSAMSVVFRVWPVLISAVLSVLIWDFFFIPPFLSFHPISSEDVVMLSMYFIVVLLNGVFTWQVRRIEQQTLLKEEKLRALNFYNTIFNSVSHGLRTPITTIIGVTENLLSPATIMTEKDRVDLNQEVLIAAERLNQLVDNLLNMSRIESGFLEAKKTWCDVNELIYKTLEKIPDNLKERQIRIFIPDDMLLVKLDFGLMEQALYNVVHNALIHTPAETLITVSALLKNNQLEISVEDDGPGFGDDMQEKQAGMTPRTAKAGGLGLGLTIVRGFVAMHGGDLLFRNRVAGGAMVKIIIPTETMDWSENYE